MGRQLPLPSGLHWAPPPLSTAILETEILSMCELYTDTVKSNPNLRSHSSVLRARPQNGTYILCREKNQWRRSEPRGSPSVCRLMCHVNVRPVPGGILPTVFTGWRDNGRKLVILFKKQVWHKVKSPQSHVDTGFSCLLPDPDNHSELISNLRCTYILYPQIYCFIEACPCQVLVLGRDGSVETACNGSTSSSVSISNIVLKARPHGCL